MDVRGTCVGPGEADAEEVGTGARCLWSEDGSCCSRVAYIGNAPATTATRVQRCHLRHSQASRCPQCSERREPTPPHTH